MTNTNLRHAYSLFFPPGPVATEARKRSDRPVDGKHPWHPDWILILMGILFLLTALILWFVDFPSLLR